ncbi:hypothetical protein PAXRUDRAFT_824543 [Paxillus rubicundulus Ve08.2h10]|uniref:Uncharacterized protein n=1 Tax=Paxillus rubicundulus Ve08.2h10 TaxID=930991 RepID=A0A0D0EBL3_9AGAM|nr:hypothetical protein PAXRUDRAFT_824543 [Paxillus rubicundulus Ve08.2h10]
MAHGFRISRCRWSIAWSSRGCARSGTPSLPSARGSTPILTQVQLRTRMSHSSDNSSVAPRMPALALSLAQRPTSIRHLRLNLPTSNPLTHVPAEPNNAGRSSPFLAVFDSSCVGEVWDPYATQLVSLA